MAHAEFLREWEKELHDLCQPVTSLQCRLELGLLCCGLEDLADAARGALEDTRRIFTGIERMREHLLAEEGKNFGRAEIGADGCE